MPYAIMYWGVWNMTDSFEQKSPFIIVLYPKWPKQ
jgi:hypothetical protein